MVLAFLFYMKFDGSVIPRSGATRDLGTYSNPGREKGAI
jgi:hypothetical protein